MAAGIVLEGGHWRVMGRRARAHPLSVHCPVPARVSPGRLRERAHVGHLQSTTSVTGNTRACLLQLGVSGQRHGRPLAPSRTPSPPPLAAPAHAPCSHPCWGPGPGGVCTRPTPAASRPHRRCGLRVCGSGRDSNNKRADVAQAPAHILLFAPVFLFQCFPGPLVGTAGLFWPLGRRPCLEIHSLKFVEGKTAEATWPDTHPLPGAELPNQKRISPSKASRTEAMPNLK